MPNILSALGKVSVLNIFFVILITDFCWYWIHRCYHSNKSEEGKNYASTLSFLDILFGTFYYRPQQAPKKLGLTNPENYPNDQNIVAVLALPFGRFSKM